MIRKYGLGVKINIYIVYILTDFALAYGDCLNIALKDICFFFKFVTLVK